MPGPSSPCRSNAGPPDVTPKILLVTRHTPLPWEDGAGAYLHDLAHYLATHGFRVEVLWLAPHEHLRWQKSWRLPDAFDPSVRLVMPGAVRFGRRYFFPGTVWYPLKAKALHRVRQLLTALGFAPPPRRPVEAGPADRPWMARPSLDELALVAGHVQARRPDIVIVSYAWLCPLFNLPSLRHVRHVCLTHDVAWHRAQFVGATTGTQPALTRRDEAGWLKSADILIAITEADASEFRALAPTARVLVAPKACPARALAASAPDLALPRLLFVGSGNLFNAAGLDWFLREVWPLVLAAVPGTQLDVCGSIDRVMPLRPAGVMFHGNVPDLAPFYRATTVVVVPLLQASGLNVKLVDAAAAGRAVVASAITLTGAPFLRNSIYSAATAGDFAAAIRLLLTDPAANARAAAAGLAAVRAHLSPDACYGSLVALLRFAA